MVSRRRSRAPPVPSRLDVARRLWKRSREVPEPTMAKLIFASWLRVKKKYQTIVRVITEEKPKIEKTLEYGQCVSPGVSPFPRDRPPALRRLGVTKRSTERGDILARRPWRSGRAASLPPPPHLQQKNVLAPPNFSHAAAASPNCSPVAKYVHPAAAASAHARVPFSKADVAGAGEVS